jgi:ubiquinone/menaquinone biosynthesis C-methylase UbiE
VVCSLILCCSPRLEETFSEVRRVLRPGGELRFFEHQRPANPIMEMTTRLLTPIWSSVFGGCDPARDTVAALRRSGFILDELTPCSFRRMTHVLGVARPGQPLGAGPGSPGGRAS